MLHNSLTTLLASDPVRRSGLCDHTTPFHSLPALKIAGRWHTYRAWKRFLPDLLACFDWRILLPRGEKPVCYIILEGLTGPAIPLVSRKLKSPAEGTPIQ